jgi:4-methyl-5(b-hydroxyethyl)-thiazole monophosphate biosynthesis
LAAAGLLEGRQATAYPGTLDGLAGPHLSTAAVVQDGQIITSRGPGTAMDFALTLIEVLCGRDRRVQVERALQRG